MKARFLFIGSATLAAGACIAILALLPAIVSVRIARASLDAPLQESAHGNASADQAAAARAQALIGALRPIAQATSSPTDVISFALAQKPAGISITNITYTGGDKSEIVLSGMSGAREAVNTFRDALEKTGRFSSVVVPVAALVGTQDGRFTVTLSGSF